MPVAYSLSMGLSMLRVLVLLLSWIGEVCWLVSSTGMKLVGSWGLGLGLGSTPCSCGWAYSWSSVLASTSAKGNSDSPSPVEVCLASTAEFWFARGGWGTGHRSSGEGKDSGKMLLLSSMLHSSL